MNKWSLLIISLVSSSTVMAAEAQPAPGMGNTVMLVAFMAIFYFMIWRPQSKRAKEHRNLMSGLQTGDEVLTSGGILGQITKIADDYVSLKLANNVEIKMQKSAIVNAIPKGTMESV